MTEKDFYKVAAATIEARKGDVITLIRKNGIAINSDASKETMTNAVLSLIKTSKTFRSEFGDLILNTRESYINLDADQVNYNYATGGGKSGSEDDPSVILDVDNEKGKFGKWLGELFTPDFTRSTLDNVMNIVSIRMGAGSSTPYNQLNNAYYDTPTPERKGLGVGGMIAIGVGAIALIAVVVYYVRKK
jgi:hypothetical protein